MKAFWEIANEDVLRWTDFVQENKNKALPRARRRRNVKRINLDISKQAIWGALVGCQVTTQQKSGPGSKVAKFLDSESPVLDLRACIAEKNLEPMISTACKKAGLRRNDTIANNLVCILENLESGEWEPLLSALETIRTHTTLKKEQEVVSYILRGGKFPGLGQKQARNFIQWLGLSRYEIPLDSRVLKKMKQLGASFVPKGAALVDETVYLFVQSSLQQLSEKLGLYPCELDACIFASFDVERDQDVGD
ncbi:hypothetical protein [Rugamonas apoptosis]|uniref:Uncharacterized protein n=1 Tax=Rugamonas apoptosis TaxID=2758570 RepID=A0A7W2F711_9BURK|nr:hypothetical protein [Rugamonas apoptosis]MBA5686335.1 hypothetical protein [Rugamonas apoptosis]